jgi:hypothetical protein
MGSQCSAINSIVDGSANCKIPSSLIDQLKLADLRKSSEIHGPADLVHKIFPDRFLRSRKCF